MEKAPVILEKKDKLAYRSTSLDSMVITTCIVLLQIRHPRKKKSARRNYLSDSCCQGTYIMEQLLKGTVVSRAATSLSINTMNGEASYNSNLIYRLEVSKSEECFLDKLPLTR